MSNTKENMEIKFREGIFRFYISQTDIENLQMLLDTALKFREAHRQLVLCSRNEYCTPLIRKIKSDKAIHKAHLLAKKVLWHNSDCNTLINNGFIHQTIDLENDSQVYALAILISSHLLKS